MGHGVDHRPVFDADLFRVRRVRVTLRLQAARPLNTVVLDQPDVCSSGDCA